MPTIQPRPLTDAEQQLATRVARRWDQLMAAQWLFHPIWRDATDLIAPNRSNIAGWKAPYQRFTDRLFDATAVHANTILAASMQGSLTSGSMQWFGIRVRGLELDKSHPISLYLEHCAKLMGDEIRQSNFASEVHEIYGDMGVIGTGCLMVDEKERRPGEPWAGLRFTAQAPGFYCIDEDGEGRVDVLYRKLRMTPRAVCDMFGMANVSEGMARKADTGDPLVMEEIIHAIYPRRSLEGGRLFQGNMTGAFDTTKYETTRRGKNMPYASVYIELLQKRLLREGGYHEMPFMVPRWSKASGEIYGRGPGLTALPDIKTLNKTVELKLKALSKIVDPPVKVRDEGVIGSVRLTPGGLTHVRDMDAVAILDLGGRLDVVDMEEEKLRKQIRQIFFSDQLQLQEGPQMTAYEVQVRYELMQRILGPTLGRLETELLDPLINRVFWMMDRAKLLPPMPPELRAYLNRGKALDIVYEGPLARAARLSETVATQRFLQTILPMAEQKPDLLDNVDLDELVRDTAINTGVKMTILRSPEDVQAIRDQKAKQDAENRQMQQMQAGAQAAGKGAPALQALIQAQKAGILPEAGAATSGPMVPQSP